MFEIETIINGLMSAVLTGAGVAIGTWLSNRMFLSKMERLLKNMKKAKK